MHNIPFSRRSRVEPALDLIGGGNPSCPKMDPRLREGDDYRTGDRSLADEITRGA
jgi:hypothetical protein